MSIFEQATKQKLRFPTTKGDLTVEQVWDLPLQAVSAVDLDNLAKSVKRELNALTEESFVNIVESPAKSKLELKLEILKHIIGVKLKIAEDNRDAAAKREKREKLLSVLADKQDEALKSLTPEEIQKQLEALK